MKRPFRRKKNARREPAAQTVQLPEHLWVETEIPAWGSKEAISIRLDKDTLDWFRKSGPRYQSRMNAVLRAYVWLMRRKRRRIRAGALA